MSNSGRIINVNLGAKCCETARVGPPGPTGPRGAQGDSGPLGPIGPQGFQGGTGMTGPMGDRGPSAVGVQGAPGMIGPVGPQGFQGVSGGPGDIGPPGVQGFQGDMGQGAGPVGPIGPVGPVGPPGAGPTGPMGPTGPEGPVGATGTATNAYGMIHKSDGSIGRFRAGASTPLLIQSQIGFDPPCNASTTWLSSGALNNLSIGVDGNGLPVQFMIELTGIYLFTYNLSFSHNAGGGSAIYRFSCRTNSNLIPGSESQLTIVTDDTRYHISHSFTYTASPGNLIGVYAESVGGGISICTSMYDGSFTAQLLSQ